MLTITTIKQAHPKDKPYRLFDGQGLYIEVRPNGSKYWRHKYRFEGKEKRLSHGVFPEVSLKDARQKRDEARVLLAKHIDPSAYKQALYKSTTQNALNSFGAIASEWHSKKQQNWSPSHSKRVKDRIENDLAALSNRPITEITPPELLQSLRKIENRGAHETARRVKQIAGQVFRYAVATGKAERDVSVDLKGALITPKQKHLAAIIEPEKVGELLRMLDGYHGTPVTKAALNIAPRLFVRIGELRHMTWEDVDLQNALWSIPAEKMKMNLPHLVPLSKQVVSELQELKQLTGNSEYAFPSIRTNTRPMSDNTITAAFRRLGITKDEMTGHGFRAMARTLLDEVLNFPVDWIEHQLAHAVRDTNGRAYNRTSFIKQRKEMMQAWSDYLDELKQGRN